MDWAIGYLVAIIVLTILLVRAGRGEATGRPIRLISVVFFFSLAIWVVTTLYLSTGLHPLGNVFASMNRDAPVVGGAAFVAVAFLALARAARR